jgi:hypothetical protein
MKNFTKKFSRAFFCCLFICLSFTAFSQPVLTTDLTDYYPGQTVIINGCGFAPFELITIQVIHVDGSPPDTGEAHEPWTMYVNGIGCFEAYWVVDLDAVGELLEVRAWGQSSSLYGSVQFTDNIACDFRQSANNETNGAVQGLGNVHWINSIVQSSNSSWHEGMSNFQRVFITDIPATTNNIHSLKFKHMFTKGGIHAYDFITGRSSNLTGTGATGTTGWGPGCHR